MDLFNQLSKYWNTLYPGESPGTAQQVYFGDSENQKFDHIFES